MFGSRRGEIKRILKRELGRHAAVVAANREAEVGCFTADFEVVATSGLSVQRRGYVEAANSLTDVRGVEWRNVQAEIFGEVAVVSGEMAEHLSYRANGRVAVQWSRVTQVWVRKRGKWRLDVMQSCPFIPNEDATYTVIG